MIDIPCGDFHWMQHVDLSGIQYVGADVVQEAHRQEQFWHAKPGIRFLHLDLINGPLPTVDLVFCRDCLVHFSYAHIRAALRNIVRSESTYLMATTFASRRGNTDISTGGWRPLNLAAPPFAFPEPLVLLNEGCTEAGGRTPTSAWPCGGSMTSMLRVARSVYRRFLKRPLDAALAALALLALSPLFLGIALGVRSALGRPILFRQRRPGLHGAPFEILKFRTMRDALDGRGTPLPDAERLTRLGRFLRATSLDELPELVNVLRGEMSLVGPRPLLMEYLPRYSPEQRRRHDVRPGITGWAQVHGRNTVRWDDRFRLDVWYVDHLGFALDLQILLRTIRLVLRREGISARGHATMPPFQGGPP